MRISAITNPDKIFWPEEGYTKADLITYYKSASSFILPYLKDRPVALHRFPDGITGDNFFQKNMAGEHMPSFVATKRVKGKTTGTTITYAICNNEETLLYLANLGCIELHPWNSRVGSLNNPDYMIFDLDPGPKTSFSDVVTVAQAANRLFVDAGVESFCKTSGKRGIHIYIPLDGTHNFKKIRELAKQIAHVIVAENPSVASLEHWPEKRKDKVYVDVMRNAVGQTTIAPYCLRPWPGAPVSTPLEWSELKSHLDSGSFNIKTILKRLLKKGEVWSDFFKRGSHNYDRLIRRYGQS